jgi:hypothetical protein
MAVVSGKRDTGETGGWGQSLCSVCLQAGLYNPSVLLVPKTKLKKSAFLRRFQDIPPLPTFDYFFMATVDLNHVQFWAPPSNPLLYKKRATSP